MKIYLKPCADDSFNKSTRWRDYSHSLAASKMVSIYHEKPDCFQFPDESSREEVKKWLHMCRRDIERIYKGMTWKEVCKSKSFVVKELPEASIYFGKCTHHKYGHEEAWTIPVELPLSGTQNKEENKPRAKEHGGKRGSARGKKSPRTRPDEETNF
jgi:hypothetical protein